MKPGKAWSVALIGLEGAMVEVEAHVSSGLAKITMVGLPDAALSDAKDRCKAAMQSRGYGWPSDPVTINLSPATLPKAGSHYDLSIAAAMGVAGRICGPEVLADHALLGELALDGRVRPVRGLLPALLGAQKNGFDKVIVPVAQLREAALVEGISVTGVSDLDELFEVLKGGEGYTGPLPEPRPLDDEEQLDLADVAGQLEAKWALEVAAAGRHHMFLHGPPGVGKTLLAQRLPSILPDLDVKEALEVAAIRSLSGGHIDALQLRPPFAAPHHTATVPSLVGGGSGIAAPGAASFAHRGVLFMDEAPEFSPRAMEALRVPLESGQVVLARSAATAIYPARFQLVMAANPCPCGMHSTPGAVCKCSAQVVRRYAERVSGPVLDRIDINQHVRPMRKSFLKAALQAAEPSKAVAVRVLAARDRARHRLREYGLATNAEVPGAMLRRELPLPDGVEQLEDAVSRGKLSARGVDKVLRLSWSIADLAGLAKPGLDELNTALAMRRGESH
jgi:magnesium chelatase family protein